MHARKIFGTPEKAETGRRVEGNTARAQINLAERARYGFGRAPNCNRRGVRRRIIRRQRKRLWRSPPWPPRVAPFIEKAARSKSGKHVAGVTPDEATHQKLAIVAVGY